MRSIDTNVLVRLIVRDDLTQAQAAESFVRRGAWVSHLVLAETTWVLQSVYGLMPPDIASMIEMLLDHEHLALQDAEVVSSALECFRSRSSLGFSDCLIIEIAKKAGHSPLGTFDRVLSKIAGAEKL
jgi:predicted nucleic-acid-binding protein